MAVDALAVKLGLLLELGNLPSSRLTESDRNRLRSLFDAGVLEMERSGAGKKVVVKKQESLGAFVTKNYPSGLEGRQEVLTPRSGAVAELRDSKREFAKPTRSWSCYGASATVHSFWGGGVAGRALDRIGWCCRSTS